MRLAPVALVGCLALAASFTAHAEVASSTETAQAEPSEGDLRAAELFSLFEQAYAAGKLADAREHMRRAFEISGRSELLYNLGEVDRELGSCRLALTEYREYLRLTPEPQHGNEASAHIAVLLQACPDPAPAAVPPKPARPKSLPAPKPESSSTVRAVGWGLLAASVVQAAIAVHFTLRMRDTADAQVAFSKRNASLPVSEREPWDRTGQSLQERGEREQALAWATGALAVLSASAGAYLLLRSSSAERPPASSWSLLVDRKRALLGCSLRF
ncbi:MAG: hypothetical protein ACOY0T_25805 [Myxococcota bacterium]